MLAQAGQAAFEEHPWCKMRMTTLAANPERLFSRRDVAQPGSALAWGARGRRFKSGRPDQLPREVLRCAQDFGWRLRRRQNASTWGARGRRFKSGRPDQLP